MANPKFAHSPLWTKFLLLFGVFALLICDAAAGLASGLARGLAFAAAAVLSAFAQVTGSDSLDVFHVNILRRNFILFISLTHFLCKVKMGKGCFFEKGFIFL